MSLDQLALAGTAAVLTVFLFGLWQLIDVWLQRSELERRSDLERVEAEYSRLRYRLDAALRRTRLGAGLEHETSTAGVDLTPLDLLTVYVAAGVLGFVAINALAPAALGVVGGVAVGFFGVRQWLARRRRARLEQFVAQLPDLARTLANATAVGRSLLSALQLAAQDLDDPAGAELTFVAERLRIGQSVDAALESLRERLPSRELAVLVSTLVIQQRSGGDVVVALRDMSETLETRKELRREIKTTVSSAVQTGYVTGAMGVGLVLLVNAMQPGMIDTMVRRVPGQIALLVAGALYAVAFLSIRRLTHIDV